MPIEDALEEPELLDALQVADEAGFTGKHRAATARKTMSRLGVPTVYERNANGRPVAKYPAAAARAALDARPGRGVGGGPKSKAKPEKESPGA